MLQKIGELEWTPEGQDPDCWQWRGEYDGKTVYIVDQKDADNYHEIDLPPGVVLAQEVAQGDRTMDNTDDMTPQEQAAIRYEVAHMNCDDMPPINGVPARLLFDLVDVAGYAVTFAGEVDDPADPNAYAYLLDVAQATASSGREWLEGYLAREVPAPADPFVPDRDERRALRRLFVETGVYVDERRASQDVVEAWVRSWPEG